MRRNHLLLAVAAVALLILAYAWIDGGREPVRMIAEPVAFPGATR